VTSARTFVRLFDSITGQHLQTSDAAEAAALTRAGWKSEGNSFTLAPVPSFSLTNTGFNAVTRLAHSNGDHLLTTSTAEVSAAQSAGYRLEGVIGVIAAASTGSATDQVLRLFNKALGQHLYTTSSAEASGLIAGGWTSETALGYV
jgi:hypothetical protein